MCLFVTQLLWFYFRSVREDKQKTREETSGVFALVQWAKRRRKYSIYTNILVFFYKNSVKCTNKHLHATYIV